MGEPQNGANLQTKRGLIRPRELPGNQVTVALVQIHLTDSRTEIEIVWFYPWERDNRVFAIKQRVSEKCI